MDKTPTSKEIIEKIEDFFNFANLKCSCCDELQPDAIGYGIHSLEEWEQSFNNRLNFLKNHKCLVLLNLAPLRKKWSECCKALEQVLNQYH